MFTYLIDQSGALNGPKVFPPIPGLGAQLPSNAVELSEALPPPTGGNAWTMIEGQPAQTADLRGKVFRTDTGQAIEWNQLGELPDGYTCIPCPGLYYVWRDGSWLLDTEAQCSAEAAAVRVERDILLRDAGLRIAPLQYAHDLGEATEEEEAELLSWKRYSVALNRVDKQPGFPLQVDWPPAPEA